MKKPPYSRQLAERAKARPWQTRWLIVGGDAWQMAQAWESEPHRPFAICPPGEDPAAFDWSGYRSAPPPVGLVRAGEVDGDQAAALVHAVLATGAPRIYDLKADLVYTPAGARRAA